MKTLAWSTAALGVALAGLWLVRDGLARLAEHETEVYVR